MPFLLWHFSPGDKTCGAPKRCEIAKNQSEGGTRGTRYTSLHGAAGGCNDNADDGLRADGAWSGRWAGSIQSSDHGGHDLRECARAVGQARGSESLNLHLRSNRAVVVQEKRRIDAGRI